MMQCFAASNDNKQRRREERLLYEAFQHGRVVSIRKDLTEEPPLPPTPSLVSTSSLSSSATTTTKPKQAAFRKVLQALQEQHHQHQQLQLGRRRRRRHQEDFCLLRPQDGRLESSSKKYNQRGKYKVLKDRATGNPLSISGGGQENIQGPNGTSNGTVTASATASASATGGDGELLIRKTIRSVRHTRSCTNCKFRDWSKGDVVYLLLSNKSSHENDENEIDEEEEEEEGEEDYSYYGYGNGETQDEMDKAPTKVVLHWLCPDCALKFGMPRSYYHQNRNVLCPVASRNRPVPRELPWWSSWGGGEMFLQNCSVYDWLPDCFATYGETNNSSKFEI